MSRLPSCHVRGSSRRSEPALGGAGSQDLRARSRSVRGCRSLNYELRWASHVGLMRTIAEVRQLPLNKRRAWSLQHPLLVSIYFTVAFTLMTAVAGIVTLE